MQEVVEIALLVFAFLPKGGAITCYLNREPVILFNNELRWVIDNSYICQCTNVVIGVVHKIPQVRSFQPFVVECPKTLLHVDAELLTTILQCNGEDIPTVTPTARLLSEDNAVKPTSSEASSGAVSTPTHISLGATNTDGHTTIISDESSTSHITTSRVTSVDLSTIEPEMSTSTAILDTTSIVTASSPDVTTSSVSTEDIQTTTIDTEISTSATVCSQPGPLGMEDGSIPDSSISASTTKASPYAPPEDARYNGNHYWDPDRNDPNPWIQVDLGEIVSVSGLITQGDGGQGSSHDWVATLSVQVGTDEPSLEYIKNGQGDTIIFPANTDSVNDATITFPEIIQTQLVRIFVGDRGGSHVQMRFEVLGCRG